jgi:hypothetical protein
MKNQIFNTSFIRKVSLLFLVCSIHISASAQESFGNTFNLGVGIGYYRPSLMPVVHANYEFNVAKDFTLAPFVTFITYRNDYYWGNNNYPYRYYRYRETVIPIGVKGTYYLDDALNLNSNWDIYLAGSLGFTIVRTTWEDGYYGDRRVYRNGWGGSSPLYLDVHVGTEYHLNDKVGLFLDLSSGISTFGIGIH